MRSTISMLAGLAATLILAALASPVLAAPIPPPGVTIDTLAQYGLQTDPTAAGPDAGSSSFFSDQALALGAAALPGSLQSFSQAGGAGGVSPVGAHSTVNQVTNWVAGGVGPSTSVDLDLTIALDGLLRTADFAGTGPGSLISAVSLSVIITTELGGSQQIFGAGADLENVNGLIASGDWGSGDFTCGPVGSDQTCTLDFSVVLSDTIFVNAGELFSIETELMTQAIVPGAFETITKSDFFNTGSISLGTSTAGASFAFVPEPSTAMLLAAGLFALGARRQER